MIRNLISYWNSNRSKLALSVTGVLISAIGLVNLPLAQAQVAQVIYSSSGDVSKIHDLVIDSRIYDVNFEFNTFLNLFNSPESPSFQPPTFWNNFDGAKKAVDAIANVLNLEQPIPQKINDKTLFSVPYSSVFSSSPRLLYINSASGSSYSGIKGWSALLSEGGDYFSQVSGNQEANYALFTAQSSTTTPEPSTLLGMLTILGFGVIFKGLI
jgi:hypothetical protein